MLSVALSIPNSEYCGDGKEAATHNVERVKLDTLSLLGEPRHPAVVSGARRWGLKGIV